MKFILCSSTAVLLLCASLPAPAEPWGFIRVNDTRRNETRDAVAAHRAAKREEVMRQEAAAGRRLTPAELAELRQQVRQQWVPRVESRLELQPELIRSAESQPAERLTPAPCRKANC
ncbi:hypothetical protein H4CHR_03616 [Variovorax sp. PBS-H4]|uniref:hypothetical protein n=1 Tax=Variovorax sp. PBS-H4 TaxID=434008 RepID=UPI001316C43B|nr:hypothetical protein [Variovorax sp. PBS-H4]VTU35283.1 hypothetical protein H4CHR_03616 [Variovorax sp. PBS-H4]